MHYDVLSVHKLSPETLDINEVFEVCSERSDVCDKYAAQSDQCIKQTVNHIDFDSKHNTELPKRCKVKRKKRVNLVKKKELARKIYSERKMRKCDDYKTNCEFREVKKAKCRKHQNIKYRTDETERKP